MTMMRHLPFGTGLETSAVGDYNKGSRVRNTKGFLHISNVLLVKSLREIIRTIPARALRALTQNPLTLALHTILINLIFLVSHDVSVLENSK